MVPEEGVARLKPRRSRHRPLRRGSGLPRSQRRAFPPPRRPKPVRPPWTGTGEKTGAGGGGRTLAALRPRDFESRASASSATPAQIPDVVHFYLYTREREKPRLPRKVRAVVRC